MWLGWPLDDAAKLKPLTTEQDRLLNDLEIDELHPGPIVHDFDAMLQFIGGGELPVSGGHHLLPIKILPELNARMHEPLIVRLDRPQLKSYPNLQQLYLLLRATRLGVVRGQGNRARLSIDPQLVSSWHSLNPTERYFNLLEAFIDRGNPEMIGEEPGGFFKYEPIQKWLLTWEWLERAQQRFDRDYVRYHADALALMWLFGLITIEQAPADKKDGGWHPRGARRTAFGEAMIKQLRNYSLLRLAVELGSPLTAEGSNGDEQFLVEPPIEAADNAQTDAAQASGLDPESLGQLQPLFERQFPQWRNNLIQPQRPFRDGQYVLKISLDQSVWRRMSIAAVASFDDLADAILRAFKFDADHLYEFLLKDPAGMTLHVVHPAMDEGISAAEVAIGAAPLEETDVFVFHYDFGDDWMFQVLVERIDPPGSGDSRKRAKPVILERHGKPPDQYGF